MVRSKGLSSAGTLLRLLVFAVSLAACDRPAAEVGSGAEVPGVNARVLTMRINIPGDKAILSAIVVAQNKVRLGTESDRWRLFDLEARTVTYVDDVARTYRTETVDELIRRRAALLRGPAPARVARATITKSGASRSIRGVSAEHYLIQMGTYKRELWLSRDPLIAPGFLQMMVASDPLDPASAPVMSQVESELAKLEGFPLYDRSEMIYGEKPLIIEKSLEKIEQKPIPGSWITIPANYEDAAVKESSGDQRPSS